METSDVSGDKQAKTSAEQVAVWGSSVDVLIPIMIRYRGLGPESMYILFSRSDIRHEEAHAVSRAQRVITGEGAGRLWRDLAQKVVQVALAREWLNRNAPTCRWGLARAWLNGNASTAPCPCRRCLLRAQAGG